MNYVQTNENYPGQYSHRNRDDGSPCCYQVWFPRDIIAITSVDESCDELGLPQRQRNRDYLAAASPDVTLALLDELDDAWAATDRAGWVALKDQLATARKALDQNLRDATQVLVLAKGVFIRLRMTQIIGTAREALAAIAKEQTP